jgi:DeoR family transcriptional regulator of aga operon
MAEKDIPVLAVERQEFILNLLRENSIVRNTELRDLLGVSIVTVRADIKELEAKGLCKAIWGGAVTEQYQVANADYDLNKREYVNREAKRRIGARAAKLVESGHTIVVDAGTTTVELVNNLPPDLTYLRLVTNALNIASAAHRFDYIDLLVTGGSLKRPTYSLTGLQAIKVFESINSDYVFLATEGITVEHGLTSSYISDVEVKQAMIQAASTVVVLADSSKFGRVMPLKMAPLEKIDVIITDQGLSESARLSLEKEGVELILA